MERGSPEQGRPKTVSVSELTLEGIAAIAGRTNDVTTLYRLNLEMNRRSSLYTDQSVDFKQDPEFSAASDAIRKKVKALSDLSKTGDL